MIEIEWNANSGKGNGALRPPLPARSVPRALPSVASRNSARMSLLFSLLLDAARFSFVSLACLLVGRLLGAAPLHHHEQ